MGEGEGGEGSFQKMKQLRVPSVASCPVVPAGTARILSSLQNYRRIIVRYLEWGQWERKSMRSISGEYETRCLD
jgi:hypothetical protein